MQAVIDIGTNTFNLLIGEINNSKLSIVHNEENSVKLGRKGINKNFIQPDAMQRGIDALQYYKKICDEYFVEEIKPLATETLRLASNSLEFTKKAKEILGSEIKIITGIEEADYIYYGAIHSINSNKEENYLIVDIGGGSVEIIIGNKSNKIFTQSYKAGALKLLEMFNPNDPVSENDKAKIYDFFNTIFSDLMYITKFENIKTMIGTAGSFDSLIDITKHYNNTNVENAGVAACSINIKAFKDFFNLIIKSNSEQRKQIKGLVDFRVETIPMAALIMNYFINCFTINKIIASQYALKEGVLFKQNILNR